MYYRKRKHRKMRKLKIKIDCEKNTCYMCEYFQVPIKYEIPIPYCLLFDEVLKQERKSPNWLRCKQCRESEEK